MTEAYYCGQCDLDFGTCSKLAQHNSLFHDDLPSTAPWGRGENGGTLTIYVSRTIEGEHEFAAQTLKCPSKCYLCDQIIWEVAFWCAGCRVRCHRRCSENVTTKCTRVEPPKSSKPKDHPGIAKALGFDFLRRKVGANKMRYVDDKYDLDFSYISPRIIAMSFPAQGMESVYRNRLPDVARLLRSKHGDKYLIINVSDRTYDTTLFNDQVVEFGWPDHHAPLMNTLCCIVKTMDSWLRQDPEHVVVCHCKGGKGRTGVAIAAYIQFSNAHLTAEEALAKFADRRFYDETIGGVTQPSQRRIVHYFSSLVSNDVQLENRQLSMTTLILFGCPMMDQSRGSKLCFCIYEGFRLVHTTKVYEVLPNREHLYIRLDADVRVSSDVMVKAFHISKTGKTCVLRVQFHTAFVLRDYSMVFRKKDLDIACRDDRFPADGVLQVLFRRNDSVVTDTTDSAAHASLLSSEATSEANEDLSNQVSLMSFDYADFSSFFTDNPLSEIKQSEVLDQVLMMHDDYRLISPLIPFPEEATASTTPPPLPPKAASRRSAPPTATTATVVANNVPPKPEKRPNREPPRPSLPIRLVRTPPPAATAAATTASPPQTEPNSFTSYLVQDKEDAEYLSFEIATPVSTLVQKFETEHRAYGDWVKFDKEEEDVVLIDLSSPEPQPTVKKVPLEASSSAPQGTAPTPATLNLRRSRSEEQVEESAPRSAYVPYLERKESVRKDECGNKSYVPYKIRTDSLGGGSCSSPESSAFLSPPPLPPRGDRIAPGPSGITNETYCSDSSQSPRLSKSMDNLSHRVSRQVSLSDPFSPSGESADLLGLTESWDTMDLRRTIIKTQEIWFRPQISRQESQATLVTQCPGSFIIRKSQTQADSYGLTIRLEDGKIHEQFNLHPGSHKVSNFLIQRKEKGGNYFINGYGSVDFPTLEELVEYFTKHTGGLPHPLRVPLQPYSDRIENVVPMLLRNVSFPVFILEKRVIRYLPLNTLEEDNVKGLLSETLAAVDNTEVRLISMSVTKHGVSLTDPDCLLFDIYNIPYKEIKNCEVGSKEQTVTLPEMYRGGTVATFGLIHRDRNGEIVYVALAEYEDKGVSITKTINKFRSYLV